MNLLSSDAPAQDRGPFSTLLGGNVNIGLSDRMKKVVAAYVLTSTTIEVVRRTHRRVRARFVYTIAVPSTDDIYDLLHQRILALIPEKRRRSIVVKAQRGPHVHSDGPAVAIDDAPRRLRPHLFYDSTREQSIEIGGQSVRVTVEQEEAAFSDSERFFPRRDRIVFTAYGSEARDAVMAFIAETTESLNEPKQPRFYMARWSDWSRRDDLEPRQLDTVYLPDGQKEALVEDLERFLTMRAQYDRLGIPWHRGYLFHGPPGTGKTSLAKALATHLKLDVYYLPIADLDLGADGRLLQLVAAVPARAMLLLEDIDILHSARERDGDGAAKGVTMSALLNALDGVSTPAGLITVMTTNRREVLDEALVRPGRVDREEKIDFLTNRQFHQMVGGYFGCAVPDLPSIVGVRVAPAEVAEALKRHMGDPQRQLEQLIGMVRDRGAKG